MNERNIKSLIDSITNLINEVDKFIMLFRETKTVDNINEFNRIMGNLFEIQQRYINYHWPKDSMKVVFYQTITKALQDILSGYEKGDIDLISNRVEVCLKQHLVLLKEELQLYNIAKQGGRKLHIGGHEKKEGWEIFDAISSSYVDHVGNAKDLSRFEDNTFDIIYNSHVLEHFDFRDELPQVLNEWARVLKPGGKMCISVPDMDTLSALFTMKDKLDMNARFQVMMMMFGGHLHEYDYHYTGFNFEFLSYFLMQAGFSDVCKIEDFDLFNDTSKHKLGGIPISLNVIATKQEK